MRQAEGVNQRAEAQPSGPLRHGGEEHAGRRCHAQRRPMVLRDVVCVEAFAVVDLGQPQAVLVVLRQRDVAAVEVVEDAELHGLSSGSTPSISTKAIRHIRSDRLTHAWFVPCCTRKSPACRWTSESSSSMTISPSSTIA